MKAKRCLVCGTLNPVSELDCRQCGESLLQAKIVDDEDSMMNLYQKSGESAIDKQCKVYRICPSCYKHVRPNTYKCECGTTLYGLPIISDELTSLDDETVSQTSCYMISSEDGRFETCIHNGEVITIGRDAIGSDYLCNKLYVSREHASIQLKDGIAIITHLSLTNCTLVNGVSITRDVPYKLSENDLISLGAKEGQAPVENAAYFRIRRA